MGKATKFLLVEGMVVVKEVENTGKVIIECAAPILRSLMISYIQSPPLTISEKAPDTTRLDPRWLLARTIEVDIT